MNKTHEHQDLKWKPKSGEKPPLSLSLSSIIIIKKTFYNFVLVQTHTSTQASTCRRLQPSLAYQPFLEGSFNPLKIAPVSTGRMLLLKGLTLRLTADCVSLIFTLDQVVSILCTFFCKHILPKTLEYQQ
jgi:hypothetical protein